MATKIQNAYKDATLTFTDDKITWHCPHPTNHGPAGTYEVMMDWEQPIMEKMAEVAVSEGDHVLECGFGMGILSDAIQARNPASHTICEFHPQVIEKAKAWAADKPNVTIHEDKWWSLYGTTGRYDAILMDTYADDDLHGKFRMFCTAKIAKTGGKVTWWNFSGGDSDEYMKFYWEDGVTFTDVAVDPPMNSYYNKDIYKVPLKILTPPATGRGIVSDVTVNMPDSTTKEIEAIHNHSIVTCADVNNPSFVNQTSGRTLVMVCKGVYNINNGLLKDKSFLVTGKLNGISRAEIKSLIEENSGKTVSSVSNKLNFLIVGEKPTKRKVENAKQLKIKIIDQNEFLKMLNKTS